MQIPKFNHAAFLVLALSFSSCLHSQGLTEVDKNEAIQTIAKLIAGNYVYPEKGGQIASHIQTANYKGDFRKAGNWQQFNQMVTKSLQEFSKDIHLYVRNDPQKAQRNRLPAAVSDTDQMNIGEDYGNEINYGFSETKVLEGNIGYLRITEINLTEKSLPVLTEAMHLVENTDALIIDLRDNEGGRSEIGPVIESYFLPTGMPVLEFRSRSGMTKTDSTVIRMIEKKYEKPVYVIINSKTASAAEALAFSLQQNKRARIVGVSSAGAAFRNDWFKINDDNYLSVSTAAPYLPGTEISWQGEGVQPDIKVKKGDPVQHILSKNLKSTY